MRPRFWPSAKLHTWDAQQVWPQPLHCNNTQPGPRQKFRQAPNWLNLQRSSNERSVTCRRGPVPPCAVDGGTEYKALSSAKRKQNRLQQCRARRSRGKSFEDDVSDEDDVEPILSDSEEDDDDDSQEDEEDLGDAGVSDPTTRLFQMVKDRDYDEEEEEIIDEDEDDMLPVDESKEMSRRGRKRKTQYDRANEGFVIPGVDEEEGDVEAGTDEVDGVFRGGPLEADDLEEGDIDAIMGGAFDEEPGLESDGIGEELDEEEAEEEDMPSRASQHRPEAMPDLEELEEDMSDDLGEDSKGPVLQYPEPPERRRSLSELLDMCNYLAPGEEADQIEVTGIQNIAAEVTEGDLFVCTFDGLYNSYLFADTAIENGAVAIVSQYPLVGEGDEDVLDIPVILVEDSNEAMRRLAKAFYDDPSKRMLVVGITGSKGKTTTSWLIRGIFEEMQKVTGMVGSLEHAISVDKLTPDGDLWEPDEEDTTLQRECSTAFHLSPYKGKYQPPEATPDSLRVQKVMAGMADRGATACVYEIGLEALGPAWTRAVDVDVAVYMGLTNEDTAEYVEVGDLLGELTEVFSHLRDPHRQTAVVNIDDQHHDFVLELAKAVPVVTFSAVSNEADVYVVKANFSMWETEVLIATPAGRISLSSTLIGRHNLPNILAAVATGLALTIDGDGVPLRAIVRGIEATEIIPGRCEIIDEEQEFGVVVDAADSPETLSRLLDSVREFGPRRIIHVFGCEGERDKLIRPFMGEIAHYKADVVILTNDNPRGERPENIIADIVSGYPDDLLAHNAKQPYVPGFLQDPGRLPFEALEFSWHNCFEFRRYVMEDRWQAIRWAIGTAQPRDCVVITGKGHRDFQEWDLGQGLERGWFDDRVECRNALSKVARLNRYSNELDRRELPWMEPDERADNPRVYNVEADV